MALYAAFRQQFSFGSLLDSQKGGTFSIAPQKPIPEQTILREYNILHRI